MPAHLRAVLVPSAVIAVSWCVGCSGGDTESSNGSVQAKGGSSGADNGGGGANGGSSGSGGGASDPSPGEQVAGSRPDSSIIGVDAGRADADTDKPAPTSDGGSLCQGKSYILCEDFESTAVGSVPVGFMRRGMASVASDQAARGAHSLKISAADNGERRISTGATKLPAAHWGRVFYRVELPVPTAFVHSTIVALTGTGPTRGSAEYRVVDTVKNAGNDASHQFLYNVQPNGSEFGKGSPYSWKFDGKWHCAEWHIDGANQSYHFYFDGAEVTSIALDNGPGNYNGTDIPMSFTELRVGWNNYQSAPPGFVAWVDEVAVDTNRIGCGN